MRHKRFPIYFLTILLVAIAVFVAVDEFRSQDFPFSVTVSSDGETERISYWEYSNTYYIFLPSYADLSQTQLHVNRFSTVHIDGKLLGEATSCKDFALNTPLDLSYTDGLSTHQKTILFTQSSNVPSAYIDVPSGSMDYIHSKKGNEEAGVIRLYTSDGALQYSGNLESIKGRGNATWGADKKPYSLTLRTASDILGMGEATEWILLANAYDPSHLRNKIAYDLAAAANLSYSPDCEWIDLYLNGQYVGLYLLCERNEIHPQRVAISSNSSFLVSQEFQTRLILQNYPYISTNTGMALRIHHNTISEYSLQQIWNSVENAILADNGIDSVTEKSWTELIDLDSWARKYLIEEIFGNYDAGAVSQYFYYEETEGKVYAGPVWDMDNTLGLGEWQSLSPQALLAGRQHLWDAEDTPLFYALLQKDVFHDRVIQLYQEEFLPLLEELCKTGLDEYSAKIAQAASMNQLRWHVESAADNTDRIRTYLKERMAFLEDYWINEEEFLIVQATADWEIWCSLAVRPGETLSWLPVYENTAWYTMDTNEPFDITTPVYQSVNICLKDISSESAEEGVE